MRTFNNVAKLLAVVLMLCICNTASAATNFVLVPTANSPSAHQPVGVIGSDGFLYVGVDGWLFKIKLATPSELDSLLDHPSYLSLIN